MAEARRAWFPQFSLRTILIVIAAFAVLASIAALGERGIAWGAAVAIGAFGIGVSFAVFAGMFLLVRFVAEVRERRKIDRGLAEPSSQQSIAIDRVAKLLLIAATFGCLGSPATSWAASGGEIKLPVISINAAGKVINPPKSGLSIAIDTTWIDSTGYRPVRITATSTAGPLTADRVLTFRFHMKNGYSTRDSMVVTESLEIPLGATTASITMAVPQFAPFGSFEFETYEDGFYVKELSLPANNAFTSWTGTFQGDSASPVLLMLSPVNFANINQSRGGVQPEALVVGQTAGLTNVGPVPALGMAVAPGTPANVTLLAGLPTRWIDYTGFDIAVVSVADLKTLVDKHPAQWKAIRNWQRVGGTILVYDIGDDWEKLAEVENLLDLKPPDHAKGEPLDQDGFAGWLFPLLSDTTPMRTIANPSISPTPVVASDLVAPAETVSPERPVESDERATKRSSPFVLRADGQGMIVGVRSNVGRPFRSNTANTVPWDWVLNSIGSQRWAWFQRYGVSLSRPNDDFWNFLIPGVGLAPVLSFQVLITAFVVGIGPINYWLLKRRGKLNMLILTVPVSAALVTSALLLFALASDGLSTRVRVRSITQIDQKTGETTCWSRLSYYAGLSPGDGLVFSDDTQVVPLEYSPLQNDMATRRLSWTHSNRSDFKSPLEQQLTDGWLASRTPTQFVTARIRNTKARLAIDTKSASPAVKNQLGSDIKQLIIADEDGNLFGAADVADGQAAKLESESTAVGKILRNMLFTLVENTPQRPDAMGRTHRGFFGLNDRRGVQYARFAYNSSLGNEATPQQSTSVLEVSIDAVRNELQRNELAPRSYIAIVQRDPEVQLGLSGLDEEASLQIVRGSW